MIVEEGVRVGTLPSWLEPLYAADEMRAVDGWAIADRGVPSLDLMERAGTGVADVVRELEPQGPVRIVCGKGNNGGDGLVVARKLKEAGTPAEALLLWPEEELGDDARTNHEQLLECGGDVREVTPQELPAALEGSGAAVDAMFGTGFTGALSAPADAAVKAVNGARCLVVAVDVPSGVDASTGEAAGACVSAHTTVTFHAHKIGLWVAPGKTHAGRVKVIDIGIPTAGGGEPRVDPHAGLIDPGVLNLLPQRGPQTTKFSSGSVLVVGGSTGLTGAVCMACDAAMRAGAGWVRAAVPASLNPVFEQKLTEVMTVPLADRGGHLAAGAVDRVLEAAARADAVVLGPGLGRTKESFEVAQKLMKDFDRPLLLDADGLNALAAAGIETVADRPAPTLLTPHAGELARLLGRESSEVADHRLESAREAAARAGALVLLKGDDSLVVQPGKRLVGVSAGGSPALATAGTGDVLSGMIGAFLAKGLDSFTAACAGVYAHAQAARIAAGEYGADSVIARDVIAALPAALRQRPIPAPGASDGPSGGED